MKTSSLQEYEQRLCRVIEFVLANLNRDLPATELARVAMLSPFHFSRVFTSMFGETIGECIRRLRLERAAMQLIQSDRKIIDLALDAGFASHEAFTRAFTEAFGLPPKKFRGSNQRPHLPAPSRLHYVSHGEFDFQPLVQGVSDMRPLQATIVEVPSRRVTYLRAHGRYPETFPALWAKFCQVVGPAGLLSKGQTLSLMHDDMDITPSAQVRGDACVEVDEQFVPFGELSVQTIPGGLFAVCNVLGPYSGLTSAWSQLCGQIIPSMGYRIRAAPCYEIYANDPNRVAPDDILTVIYEPVAQLNT